MADFYQDHHAIHIFICILYSNDIVLNYKTDDLLQNGPPQQPKITAWTVFIILK